MVQGKKYRAGTEIDRRKGRGFLGLSMEENLTVVGKAFEKGLIDPMKKTLSWNERHGGGKKKKVDPRKHSRR